MAEKTYEAVVAESSKELTAREKIRIKDVSDAISIDALLDEGAGAEINVGYYALLKIHNEKAKDKDYEKIVIVDDAGTKYVTGSSSFMRSLFDIVSELKEAGEDSEPFAIKVFRKDSKNYSGKYFITCSLV